MQTIQIDLKKNPDIADFVLDKEPGDSVCLLGTIKDLDDQTLTVTVEEIDEGEESDRKDGEEKEPRGRAEKDYGADGSDRRNPQGDSVGSPGGGLNASDIPGESSVM